MRSGVSRHLLGVLGARFSVGRTSIFRVGKPLSLAVLVGMCNTSNFSTCGAPECRPTPMPRFRGRGSVFRIVHRNSMFLRRPCVDFSPIMGFIHRTTGSPSILTVGRALCHIDNGSPVVTTLTRTTRGNGRISMLMRLGTHFSRRGGVM